MAMSTIARGIDWIQVHGDLVEHHDLSAEQAHLAEYWLQHDFPHGFQRPTDIPEIIVIQPDWVTRTAEIVLNADGSPALTPQGILSRLVPNPPRIDWGRIEAWIGNPFPLRVLPQRLAEVAAVVAEMRPPIEPETPVDPPPVELPPLPKALPTNPRPGEPGRSPLRDGIPPSKAWLERMDSSPEVEGLRAALEQARAEVKAAQDKVKEVEARWDSRQAEIKAVRAEAAEKQSAAEQARAKTEQKLEALRQELQVEKTTRVKAEVAVKETQTELKDLRQELAALQGKLDDAEQARAAAVERGNAAEQERAKVEQEMEALRPQPGLEEKAEKKRRRRTDLTPAMKTIVADRLDENPNAGVDTINQVLEDAGKFPERQKLRGYVAEEKEKRRASSPH